MQAAPASTLSTGTLAAFAVEPNESWRFARSSEAALAAAVSVSPPLARPSGRLA
jgi:hypothetical protein